jgi:hypothetical protein
VNHKTGCARVLDFAVVHHELGPPARVFRINQPNPACFNFELEARGSQIFVEAPFWLGFKEKFSKGGGSQ